MKLAFISDIHGNAIALEAVLNDINRKKVDKVFVLGDLCFRGPEPQRSVDLVRSLNADVIKGNADEWIVRGIHEDEVPSSVIDTMTKERNWTLSLLNQDSINFLRNLSTDLMLEFGGVKIHAFHATPNSLFEGVHPNENDHILEEKMMGKDADIYIYGHIHKSYIRYISGKCIINPGSVGLPFDGLAKPSYAIVDVEEYGFQTSLIRVNYDSEKVIKQFINSNYPNSDLMIKITKNASIQ